MSFPLSCLNAKLTYSTTGLGLKLINLLIKLAPRKQSLFSNSVGCWFVSFLRRKRKKNSLQYTKLFVKIVKYLRLNTFSHSVKCASDPNILRDFIWLVIVLHKHPTCKIFWFESLMSSFVLLFLFRTYPEWSPADTARSSRRPAFPAPWWRWEASVRGHER